MEIDLQKIKTTKDAQEYGIPYFKINTGKDDIIKAIKSDDGVARVRLIASSDAIDMVADSFTEKALKQMQAQAVGTTVFMNHKYEIPNSIFGKTEKASLVTKEFEIDGQIVKNIALVFDVKVAMSNPLAVQTYNNILNEEALLGASVGVLVIDSKEDRNGINRIDSILYAETSIVGQPCNRQCWVTGATKTLKKMFPNQKRPIELNEAPFDLKSLTQDTASFSATEEAIIPAKADDEGISMDNKNEVVNTEKAVKSAKVTSKGFYADSYQDHITSPYFLISEFYSAFYDITAAVRTGGVKIEDIEASLGEGFDDFKSIGVPAMKSYLEGVAADASDNDWYCYSLGADAAVVKNLTAMIAITEKSGKKINADTMKDLGVVHEKVAGLMGLECAAPMDNGGTDVAEADKSLPIEASVGGAVLAFEELTTAKTALEVANKELAAEAADKISVLEAKIASLEKEKETIQKSAEDWEASSFELFNRLVKMQDQPNSK